MTLGAVLRDVLTPDEVIGMGPHLALTFTPNAPCMRTVPVRSYEPRFERLLRPPPSTRGPAGRALALAVAAWAGAIGVAVGVAREAARRRTPPPAPPPAARWEVQTPGVKAGLRPAPQAGKPVVPVTNKGGVPR